MNPDIIIYTDGSSRGNPGPGGYGIVMIQPKSNYIKEFSILHFETSENYMKNYLNFEFMPGRYNGKVQV